MIISVALNAKMRKNWREVRSEMYIRWRFRGSRDMWFWLARIISGSNQQVRTSRGVERVSVAIYRLRVVQPVSERFFSQVRLNNAIVRLCIRAVGQSHLGGTSQIVGINIRVGMRIFSIVVGLGFVVGLCRGCGQLQLAGQGLHLLHKLKMLGAVLVRRRS